MTLNSKSHLDLPRELGIEHCFTINDTAFSRTFETTLFSMKYISSSNGSSDVIWRSTWKEIDRMRDRESSSRVCRTFIYGVSSCLALLWLRVAMHVFHVVFISWRLAVDAMIEFLYVIVLVVQINATASGRIFTVVVFVCASRCYCFFSPVKQQRKEILSLICGERTILFRWTNLVQNVHVSKQKGELKLVWICFKIKYFCLFYSLFLVDWRLRFRIIRESIASHGIAITVTLQ